MSYITSNIRRSWLLFLLAFFMLTVTGCSKKTEEPETPEAKPRDNTPVVYETTSPEENVIGNELVSIDCSNVPQGYITLLYTGSNEKVKFQINTPEDITYTYLVNLDQEAMVFPLTGQTGAYTFTLYESVDVEEDLYAVVFQEETDVAVTDEFLPYLIPNIYTQFTQDSPCVSKGAELALDCYSDLDVIESIYLSVTDTITYDEEKAKNVSYGYIPSPDETLASGTGICFDYASLMTAMLRSQQIPTRLEVGYAGEIYHAWISCYVDEIGWVDNIIEFDGHNWSLMDPTLAASNSSSQVREYIGDGSKYIVKYTY